ncbi:hypothetical protein K431DRAFT_282960 [Polychaeton citri CBS 116435]|uniref:Uncharacterized protein n=1 Tax=Polychaeton citri CBS 116435 TaxID=1314669 RepID=A0A9P4QET0_9PEZI|nr:hypothetical protein K431DRAFT_282960 [Polychaeton citri CBS 116435]
MAFRPFPAWDLTDDYFDEMYGIKRKRASNGVVAGTPARRFNRSASNPSSTSSDILVASSVPPSNFKHNAAEPYGAPKVTAKRYGDILHVVNVPRDFLRRMQQQQQQGLSAQKRQSGPSTKYSHPELDDNERNSRGTFSSEYSKQHPHVEWVHRGQGRYLPKWEVEARETDDVDQSALDRRTSSRNVLADRVSSSPVTSKRQPSSSLARGGAGELATPTLYHRRSLNSDEQKQNAAYTLRQRHVEPDTPTQIELRAQRFSRRARPVATYEHSDESAIEDESEEDDVDNVIEDYYDDDDDDDDKTYRKDQVDARAAGGDTRPYYHTGNGWFKYGVKQTRSRQDSSSHQSVSQRRDSDLLLRRTSSRVTQRRESNAVKSTNGTAEEDESRTMKLEEILTNYPGRTYHHCGNGWFKLGEPESKKRPSHVAPLHDEAPEMDLNRTVSKQYKDMHPEITWVHRGNGRYKRAEDVQREAEEEAHFAPEQFSTSLLDGVREDLNKTTYHTKELEGVVPNFKDYFIHVGFGNWRPKDTYTVKDIPGLNGEKPVIPTVASRPRRSSQAQTRGAMRPTFSFTAEGDSVDSDGLVDKEYVEAHRDRNFHHRGQGRWAPGLPPLGASRKIAVSGPDAERFRRENKEPSDESEKLREKSADIVINGERPPDKTAFVTKDEVEKWPMLAWHYRGGSRWSRTSKDDPKAGPSWRERNKIGKHAFDNRNGHLHHQFHGDSTVNRPAQSVEQYEGYNDAEYAVIGKGKGRAYPLKQRSQRVLMKVPVIGSQAASNTGASSPEPKLLEPEEDILTEEDFPELYRDSWSPPDRDEPDDDAATILRGQYRPMIDAEAYIKALTKHDPAIRSTENLEQLAENTQRALEQMQDEYLRLELITAPHARIPRKAAKGGRKPLDREEYEDRKEADLYDYAFDAKRIGHQDPDAQKIQRDAEGRELRTRRKRGEVDIITAEAILGDPNAGEGSSRRRPVRPVSRFDGIDNAPKRRRITKNGSATPDPGASPGIVTPIPGEILPNGYVVPTTGRWAGHIPKRIRELRGESIGSGRADSELSNGGSPAPVNVRKGRPPGSKNQRRRKDAGIPKGPRKKKEQIIDSVEEPTADDEDGVAA